MMNTNTTVGTRRYSDLILNSGRLTCLNLLVINIEGSGDSPINR